MQYRIYLPLCFQLRNSQSFKQILSSLEIGFKGRDQQALAKTAGTAKETARTLIYHFVDKCGLINIDPSSCTQLVKLLYANRKLHELHYFVYFVCKYILFYHKVDMGQ